MNNYNHNQKPAFTIIEVVLVLAIAGLIFLMVFIALPALQRNQRDTQRRSDLARLQTALQSYRTNNRGALPAGSAQLRGEFQDNYLDGDNFHDPDGSPYYITHQTGQDRYIIFDSWNMKRPGGDTLIIFKKETRCGDGQIEDAGGPQSFTVAMRLEGGGTYCLDDGGAAALIL